MKKSLKPFSLVDFYKGHTILVYGELWEEGYIDGIIMTRAKFSKDGRALMDASNDSESFLLSRPYTRTRYFNMGYAICSPQDTFNLELGIEICKKRFRKSPLKTETGLFLTKDMIHALIRNEINYIENHWDKFVPISTDTEQFHIESVADSIAPSSEEKEKSRKTEEEKWVPKDELKGEPKSYTEGPLTEIEKLTRPTVTWDNSNDQTTSDAQPFEKGTYVRILNSKDKKWPLTIGYVNDIVDDKVYYSWMIKLGEGYTAFKAESGGKNLFTYNKELRLATKEEVSEALKAIEAKTGFHWNVSEKRLELKLV